MSFVVVLFSSNAAAIAIDISNYYASAYGLTGTALRVALRDIIAAAKTNDYYELHNHYQSTDSRPDGTVWDMYSDVPNGVSPYSFPFVSCEQCGNYRIEGDCYNREHSWPQSWFGSGSPMVSDLFHLYPTDGKVNANRGNYPFGEVARPTSVSLNGGKVGPCSTPGYTGTVFEPIDQYKGDFARTYFYMSTRYYEKDVGWQVNSAVDGAELAPWTIEMLLRWHADDPISLKETLRNEAVYAIQGNRNPYIDNEMWAYDVWGFPTGQPMSKITTQIPYEILRSVGPTNERLEIQGIVVTQFTGVIAWANATAGLSGLVQITSAEINLDGVLLVPGPNLLHITASNETGQTVGKSFWVFRQSGFQETFDNFLAWSGPYLCHKDWYNEFTTLRYLPTNATPATGDFIGSQVAIKRSMNMDAHGFSWGLNRFVSNAFVRFQTPLVVKNFSVYLAPYTFDPSLQFEIRVSTNSGLTYSTILSTNGYWLGPDRRYRRYDSPILDAKPVDGRLVFVEVYKKSGEMMFIDDWDYRTESNPDDMDMDTLPDAWEVENFGDLDSSDGSRDFDGDGYSDWSELIAGTIATNSESFLKVANLGSFSAADIPIVWESVSARYYRVFAMTNLSGVAVWTSPRQNADPPKNTYVIPRTNHSVMFYGVGVE